MTGNYVRAIAAVWCAPGAPYKVFFAAWREKDFFFFVEGVRCKIFFAASREMNPLAA